MPSCQFYALPADFIAVLDFIFAQPGWRLYEHYSRPGQPVRELRATAEVLAAYPTFHQQDAARLLQLHAKPMGGRVLRRRVTFQTVTRQVASGWGLIQIRLDERRERQLYASCVQHITARRAEQDRATDDLGPVDAWDWKEVARIARQLSSFIRQLAPRARDDRPILPAAAAALARRQIELR